MNLYALLSSATSIFAILRRSLTIRIGCLGLAHAQRDGSGASARRRERIVQRIADVERGGTDLEAAALERRELEQVADQVEQVLARRLHLRERLPLLVASPGRRAPPPSARGSPSPR